MKRDHEILRTFKNKSLQPVSLKNTDDDTPAISEPTKFTNLEASIVP